MTRYAVLIEYGSETLCVKKTSDYLDAIRISSLLAGQRSTLRSCLVRSVKSSTSSGRDLPLRVAISDNQEILRDISLWPGRQTLIEAMEKAAITPPKTLVIEGEWFRD